MTRMESAEVQRIPLSRSQQNIYNGILQDADPDLYLIGRRYRFHPIAPAQFLAALHTSILANPIQLCVLVPSAGADRYPELVRRLTVDDLVQVHRDGAPDRPWASGILGKPLVHYRVEVDDTGLVRGLDVRAHHILLDGGAIGIIEADLARALNPGAALDDAALSDGTFDNSAAGLRAVAAAHQREARRIDESIDRLSTAVHRELSDNVPHGAADTAHSVPAVAAKGIRIASVTITGAEYHDIVGLADREGVPLNVLVAAAAVAVDARARQTTEALLVHAVDNRFGEPDLDAATCLVNSIAQPVRFPAFASVAEVVRTVDRGYVKAGRRRWLREEQYRRMYLAIHRATSVETVTLNFLREPCAPELRPFLSDVPVTTGIGPVEGMTVAAVLDEQRHTLTLDLWNRADGQTGATVTAVHRIARALKSMAGMWQSPIAMIVDEWCGIGEDGALSTAHPPGDGPRPSAWFLSRDELAAECRRRRPHVDPWIAWLLNIGAEPGDVVVFTDDGTDKMIDLMIACHLAGCGYSVCASADQVMSRAERISVHGGITAHIVDSALPEDSSLDEEHRQRVDARVDQIAGDPLLATRTAYVMPTSGSTGQPKLVTVSHASLAVFCAAQVHAYGWVAGDTILQCAPLTSDISVEEVFGAALSGATLIRSAAVKSGDLQALARDLATSGATVVDLPTAVWHLWCDDPDATAAVPGSELRQIVIGGEPIRPAAVDKWLDAVAVADVSLISSYGPTEATVVVTYLPIIDGGQVAGSAARGRLGRPMVENTVVIAFGEVIVLGPMVADGYLGVESASFGSVTMADGVRRRAFATADRVTVDENGFPVFAGRKDALVKVGGKRVDTAEIIRRVAADPAIVDVAVDVHHGGLGVWFTTSRTCGGGQDTAAAARIKSILVDARVPSFVVTGAARIPRTPNGKVDTATLRASRATGSDGPVGAETKELATVLTGMWSQILGRHLTPDASLLREGVGSLDLVRILPETRRLLGRPISILDLISADTAVHLVDDLAMAATWMDSATAAEIDHDFAAVSAPHITSTPASGRAAGHGASPILVVGGSGILGSGFAETILELADCGRARPEVILAMRSVPSGGIWSELRNAAGIRIELLTAEFGPAELATLMHRTAAATVINCIGSTNVVVPYRELRSANVELVSGMVQQCLATGARLVHLSTSVVNADVHAPRVVDPRQAPYPYAASKALAELAVAGAPADLDFTIVRLPRVLAAPDRMRESTDILASVIDACRAVQAYPSIELTEEVTTGRAAAESILRRLPEFGGPDRLGRGIDVVRGQAVSYREVLGVVAREQLDAHEWKQRLDESDWARANPRGWSVIDAWFSLGITLAGRSYGEYLAGYPALPLGIESVGELGATAPPMDSLLANLGITGTGRGGPTTNQTERRQTVRNGSDRCSSAQ
ncbi:peptide synthase [Mycobacterium sp. GA-1841]|uniref:AMP-binding protein n=1 Tax=Mycobacterium sp. GA-1841 TaxID=1834154 RepID=UPI00096EB25A|nr:AMP-binding protein [Mycobacterium sp. GA-1841]OMC29574.1 peptide synthase [Mycobacterium sp. GA-1841]